MLQQIKVVILGSDQNYDGWHDWNIKHQQDKTIILF